MKEEREQRPIIQFHRARFHRKQMLAFRRPEPPIPLPARAKIEPNEILGGIYQDSLSGRETLLNSQRSYEQQF